MYLYMYLNVYQNVHIFIRIYSMSVYLFIRTLCIYILKRYIYGYI